MEEQRGRGESLKWHEAEGRRVAGAGGRGTGGTIFMRELTPHLFSKNYLPI